MRQIEFSQRAACLFAARLRDEAAVLVVFHHPVIAIPSEEDWENPEMNAMKTKLNKVFTSEKQSYTYIYDFGDDWVHQIVLEKILPEEIKRPVCLNGKGACPPEDCGGPWGYENLKTILADPKHEEYWDANYFELEEVNEMLKDYK